MEFTQFEKHIIALIAEHTIDADTDYEEKYQVSIPHHRHTFFEDGVISYHVLFNKYNNRFQRTKDGPHKPRFNNVLRTLCEEKNVVIGVALAWASVNDGKVLQWLQRKEKDNNRKDKAHYDTNPPYKLVGLTAKGWEIAKEQHGRVIAICGRMRRALKEKDG